MGRGCARQATELWPPIAKLLANRIHMHGNIVNHVFDVGVTSIYSFPVKPDLEVVKYDKSNVIEHMRHRVEVGSTIAGWVAVAHKEVIIRSAHQIVEVANKTNASLVAIPRPGCGAGGLDWNVVGPWIENILDDRFWVIGYEGDR